MSAEEDAFHALSAYTATRRDAAFLHQHVVDAFAAQQAGPTTKPIKITFALVGLYLLMERGLSGRQVQQVHVRLARRKHHWPSFVLPEDRGSVTATEVMKTNEGPERDAAIHAWCASVWAAYAGSHAAVADLLRRHAIT